jgi:molybdopterin synthase catalytic subunit
MGTIQVGVTAARLSLDAVARELSAPEHGAVLLFSAVVREQSRGRRVAAVSYAADPETAERTLRAIAGEARARFGEELSVVLVHRTGRLVVGETCLLVGVASPHREEAYQASRFVLEQFRARSPLTKKEEHLAEDDAAGAAGAGRAGRR